AGRYARGSGHGSSVLEVVRAAERVTGRRIPVVPRPPAAEPAALICDPSRALAELGWKPRRSDLDTIVRDAWATRPGRPAPRNVDDRRHEVAVRCPAAVPESRDRLTL